jgi:hypothetical protein
VVVFTHRRGKLLLEQTMKHSHDNERQLQASNAKIPSSTHLGFDSKGSALLLATAGLTIVAGVDTDFHLSVKTSIDFRGRIDTSYWRRWRRRCRFGLRILVYLTDRRDGIGMLTVHRESRSPIIHGIWTVQDEMRSVGHRFLGIGLSAPDTVTAVLPSAFNRTSAPLGIRHCGHNDD